MDLIQKNHLESAITNALMESYITNYDLELDGQALKNDLTPILRDVVVSLINNNFNL